MYLKGDDIFKQALHVSLCHLANYSFTLNVHLDWQLPFSTPEPPPTRHFRWALFRVYEVLFCPFNIAKNHEYRAPGC